MSDTTNTAAETAPAGDATVSASPADLEDAFAATGTSAEAGFAGAASFADAESREILNLLGDDAAGGSCCGGSCCSA